MFYCSKKKELILIQVVRGTNKSVFYLVDMETSTDSLANESGNDRLMLTSSIYCMNGNTLSDFSVHVTRYTCMKITKFVWAHLV